MTSTTKTHPKPIEVWHQDSQQQDLWLFTNGIMVNSAALKERESYFDIVRIHNQDHSNHNSQRQAHSSL